MNIDLDTDTAPSPERTLQLAQALAEVARALNHCLTDHAALQDPRDVTRLLGSLSSAASGMLQVPGHAAAWLEAEQDRIEVASGPYAGRPDQAVLAVRMRLADACPGLKESAGWLNMAAEVTSVMTAAGEGSDG